MTTEKSSTGTSVSTGLTPSSTSGAPGTIPTPRATAHERSGITGVPVAFLIDRTGQIVCAATQHRSRSRSESRRCSSLRVDRSSRPTAARQLLDAIGDGDLVRLWDRALIAVMVYSFVRVEAALGMDVGN